ALAIVVLALLLAPLLRERRARTDDPAAYDLAVYRDQLAEVERDLARGVIAEDVAIRTRLEVSRRILEADRAAGHVSHGQAPRGLTVAMIGVTAVLMVGGALPAFMVAERLAGDGKGGVATAKLHRRAFFGGILKVGEDAGVGAANRCGPRAQMRHPGALAIVVLALLLAPLLRERRARTDDPAAYDLAVYRDQLAEVERDLARGVIAEDVAIRTRLEVSRRILEADRAAGHVSHGQAPRGLTVAMIGVTAVLM
ncbi:Cytochrome c-type biogenesis protein CcmH, partial [Durusdinium trenchii]